jgi:rhodanese-related sulfurtransferase
VGADAPAGRCGGRSAGVEKAARLAGADAVREERGDAEVVVVTEGCMDGWIRWRGR